MKVASTIDGMKKKNPVRVVDVRKFDRWFPVPKHPLKKNNRV